MNQYNLPFSTSEIVIGSTKNKIFISNSGDMVLVDGSLVGTPYEDGITLSTLANLESTVSLDELIDITNVSAGKSYLLERQSDDSWKALEYTPPSVVIENLNDISDVVAASPDENEVLTFSNGKWRNLPKTSTVVMQVEGVDWIYNATLLDGAPGYYVNVPHNLDLSLPLELIDVGIWNTNNELVTLNKVKQNQDDVYLESTAPLDLYVVMRKI